MSNRLLTLWIHLRSIFSRAVECEIGPRISGLIDSVE